MAKYYDRFIIQKIYERDKIYGSLKVFFPIKFGKKKSKTTNAALVRGSKYSWWWCARLEGLEQFPPINVSAP